MPPPRGARARSTPRPGCAGQGSNAAPMIARLADAIVGSQVDLNLSLMRRFRVPRYPGIERPRRLILKLLLPGVNLVGMDLVALMSRPWNSAG